MNETVSLALLQNVLNTQTNLIAIFKGSKLFFANRAFLKFFAASSVEDFNEAFRNFADCFMPHPSYFNRENIAEGETWFESILKLEKQDRIVSMLTPTYDPRAFSVDVGQSIEEYTVVTLIDVTQTLIKRIMIENNATMNVESGAYDKEYFLHVSKNYEDAAVLNEKIIGIIKLVLDDENPTQENLKIFVNKIKENIREDDMLVRWAKNRFLLVFLVDNEEKVNLIVSKIKSITNVKATISSVSQMKDESISKLINRVNS